ncbi:MAG: Fic family protein [Bacilli bacterium]|nr:Fic family protein [Bacilli bacterium]MDD4077196.1 Fic family protein [Bacilli bacterium]MDD4388186.1 Fic family protein [Bacilli bacterium]
MKSGFYKTNLSGELKYKSFYPTPLQEITFDQFNKTTVDLLSKANYEIGRLNGLSSNIKDIDLFIGSYVRKEALSSSQIEGTRATLEDILDTTTDENTNADIEEVINYVKAIKYAIDLSNELPICSRYIKQIHEVLMNGVRGNEKHPGEFRKTQNWIGAINSTIKNAKFIPPNVEDMEECMSFLEKYINEDSNIDELIKIALIHYQFETIHPFLDGNGRIGRLLIIIYLMSKSKLSYPCLYISYYLKRNQLEYYDRMSAVRNRDDYIQWIDFFLQGIIEISQESINCINKLRMLREKNTKLIKANQIWLLEFLEANPIVNAIHTSDKTKIDYSKVNRNILSFVEAGILKVSNESKKKRSYVYQEYIDILKE